MEISCSTGNYDILGSGQVFLFDDQPLKIDITANDGVVITVEFKFLSDETGEHTINSDTNGNHVVFTCVNFDSNGIGFSHPIEFAVIDDRKVFMMFWAYLEGNNGTKVRSVKYTFFSEKKNEE